MFNISERQVPLDIKDFQSFQAMPSDSLFYGSILKNNFDIEKTTINSQYSPQKLYTIIKIKNGFSILYLYGTFLKVKPQYKELLSSINLFSQIPTSKHTLKNYFKILDLYNLSCEESYLYFNKDIYPIDSSNCNMLFSNFKQSNFFISNTSYPFYLTLTSPYILYFTNMKNNLVNFNNYLHNISLNS